MLVRVCKAYLPAQACFAMPRARLVRARAVREIHDETWPHEHAHMLPTEVASMTLAVLFTALYVICMAVLMAWPQLFEQLLAVHGLGGLTWVGLATNWFIIGAVAHFIVGYAVGWLFAKIWNHYCLH